MKSSGRSTNKIAWITCAVYSAMVPQKQWADSWPLTCGIRLIIFRHFFVCHPIWLTLSLLIIRNLAWWLTTQRAMERNFEIGSWRRIQMSICYIVRGQREIGRTWSAWVQMPFTKTGRTMLSFWTTAWGWRKMKTFCSKIFSLFCLLSRWLRSHGFFSFCMSVYVLHSGIWLGKHMSLRNSIGVRVWWDGPWTFAWCHAKYQWRQQAHSRWAFYDAYFWWDCRWNTWLSGLFGW